MIEHIHHRNTILRARQVKQIVDELYEPGRLDRCKLWVYRHHVRKVYCISERTFFFYLSIADLPLPEDTNKPEYDKRQLRLFDDF